MFSGTSLVGRVTITAFVIVLASLVLSATLNLLKFEKVVRQKEQARFEFLTSDLASAVQDGMRIGLPLSALRSIQPLIDRRRTIDQLIERIVVFDEAGRRLYSTDRATSAEQPVPQQLAPSRPRERSCRGPPPGPGKRAGDHHATHQPV